MISVIGSASLVTPARGEKPNKFSKRAMARLTQARCALAFGR